jgi:hypothetical protein
MNCRSKDGRKREQPSREEVMVAEGEGRTEGKRKHGKPAVV